MITAFSNCLCYNNVKRYGFIMNVMRKKEVDTGRINLVRFRFKKI